LLHDTAGADQHIDLLPLPAGRVERLLRGRCTQGGAGLFRPGDGAARDGEMAGGPARRLLQPRIDRCRLQPGGRLDGT
jgi:hypothetical protein